MAVPILIYYLCIRNQNSLIMETREYFEKVMQDYNQNRKGRSLRKYCKEETARCHKISRETLILLLSTSV
jgi:hypothetical protein